MSKQITCSYSTGMLPSEYSVTIHIDGRELSLFSPKSFVVEENAEKGEGLLEVQIIDEAHNVIGLPGEVFEIGHRFVEYPMDKLKSA